MNEINGDFSVGNGCDWFSHPIHVGVMNDNMNSQLMWDMHYSYKRMKCMRISMQWSDSMKTK